MRRTILIFLIALAIVAFSVRILNRPPLSPPNPPGSETRLVEYIPRPLSPLPGHPLSQMQNILDDISEFAVNGSWNAAAQAVEQLQQFWERWQFRQHQKLKIEQEITDAVQTLHHNVWAKDRRKALITAQNLTDLINRLSGQ